MSFADTGAVERAAREGLLIDVRTPAEFAAVRIPGASNIPLDELGMHAARLAALPGILVLTCHSGKRAEQARLLLASCDRRDRVLMVQGGTSGWLAAGGAVEGDGKVISLERQVRIAAGFLVFIGAVLSLTVSSSFVWLPLAVGGGLMFAGITDTCMLGMLLARMPWNRRKTDSGATVSRLEAACCSPE